MAQTKSKGDQKKSRKKHSMVILDNAPTTAESGEDDTVVLDDADLEPSSIWKEEVEGLLGQKFSSILEVIDAIADRVCLRLGQQHDSNLHEFIVMMLDTDEEIREELQVVFNLK